MGATGIDEDEEEEEENRIIDELERSWKEVVVT
jgi:hypothetical protein